MSGTRPARGVTLIEMIIFIVVIGIAVVGVLAAYTRATASNADPVRRKQALLIAESLMEEVSQAKITDNDNWDYGGTTTEGWGPEAGNSRPYDNLNDYVSAAGVANSTVFNDSNGKLVDASGAPLGGSGYQASITVTPAALGTIVPGSGVTANCFLVSITVTFDNQSLTLETYRTRYAPATP